MMITYAPAKRFATRARGGGQSWITLRILGRTELAQPIGRDQIAIHRHEIAAFKDRVTSEKEMLASACAKVAAWPPTTGGRYGTEKAMV